MTSPSSLPGVTEDHHGILTVPPKPAAMPTLIQAENWLQELAAELMELAEAQGGELTPEQAQSYELTIRDAIKTTVDKRQRVAEAILHFEAQAEFGRKYAAEIARRSRTFDRIAEGIRGWVLNYILTLPKEIAGKRKGQYPALEGHTTVMRAQGIVDQINITNAGAIPLDMQKASVTMTAAQWGKMARAALAGGFEVPNDVIPSFSVDMAAVEEKLKAWKREKPCDACVDGKVGSGEWCPKCDGLAVLATQNPVPGTEYVTNRKTLVVK